MLRLDLPRHPLQLLEELFLPARAGRPGRTPAPSVPLELLDRDDAVTLRAMLPGLRPESIDVTLERGELRIRGERVPSLTPEEREQGARVLARELPTAPVDVRLRLGFRPEAEGVRASYELGVLAIDVPRAAAERAHKVPVTTA